MVQGPQYPLEGWQIHAVPEWRLLHKPRSAHSKQAKSYCCSYSDENKTLRNWRACMTTKGTCTICAAVLDVEQQHDFYPIHAWISWASSCIYRIYLNCDVLLSSLLWFWAGFLPTHSLLFVGLILLMLCRLLWAVYPSIGLRQLLWLQAELRWEPALVFPKATNKLLLLQLAN